MNAADVPRPRLRPEHLKRIDAIVAPADERIARLYPGDGGRRQPVHTVYVPADRVSPGLTVEWGAAARKSLDEHAPSAGEFAAALGDRAVGAEPDAFERVWQAMVDKLHREPVEDLRIDLEDGYGDRGDATEDRDVVAAARALVSAREAGAAPPYSGIRFKSFEAATRGRALRTLDLVTGALLEGGPLPDGWVLTLPKVTSVEQVHAMVEACRTLEAAYGLPDRSLRFEVQVETPQSILAADGTALVARLVHEADRRCVGLHFGTYDYTAALGVAAGYQAMDHPAADHAKAVMAVAAAGTGVRLSDGSSNVLPVGDTSQVHAAWALHARLLRRSLERGLYQGWDLHPAQLPTRFAATYLFFRQGLDDVGGRLSTYLAGGTSRVLDEPATAQALAGFLLRGVHCGAVSAGEVAELTGADVGRLSDLARRRVG